MILILIPFMRPRAIVVLTTRSFVLRLGYSDSYIPTTARIATTYLGRSALIMDHYGLENGSKGLSLSAMASKYVHKWAGLSSPDFELVRHPSLESKANMLQRRRRLIINVGII